MRERCLKDHLGKEVESVRKLPCFYYSSQLKQDIWTRTVEIRPESHEGRAGRAGGHAAGVS